MSSVEHWKDFLSKENKVGYKTNNKSSNPLNKANMLSHIFSPVCHPWLPVELSSVSFDRKIPYFSIKSNKYCAFRHVFQLRVFPGKYPVSGLPSRWKNIGLNHIDREYSALVFKFPFPPLELFNLCKIIHERKRRKMKSFLKFSKKLSARYVTN